jgi:hypothetical protein
MKVIPYDKICSIVVVAEYSSPSGVKQLVKQVQEVFPDKKEIEYLFYVDEKQLPEMLPTFKGINYCCKGDFGFIGNIKSDKLNKFLQYHEFDAMVYFCHKNSKNVQKTTNRLKYKFSVGFERENLPNFDLAFIAERPTEDQLLALATTYLKKL